MSADVYLNVQTKRAGKVKGEASAEGHEGDILLRRWNWGVAASSALGSTQATARRSYKSLTIVKSIDTASTALLSALVTNDEVREARLTMRKAGEGQQDYFILSLANARIASVDMECDEAGDAVERVTVNFNKVELEYRLQQGTGQRGAGHTFTDELLAE